MRNHFSYLETIFVLIVFGILIGALLLNKGNTYRKNVNLGTTYGQPDISPKTNLLEIVNGTLIVSVSSTCTQTWKALNLIKGPAHYGWCSAKGTPFPHTIVFELSQPYAITGIAIDNRGAKEDRYPGISAKEIMVSGSSTSAHADFTPLITLVTQISDRQEAGLNSPVTVQWLKFTVNSNWGNSEYTEIMGIEAYGQPVGSTPKLNIAGVYQTNYGALALEQNGTRIMGCYDFAGGKLSGDLNGRVMQFEWSQEQNRQSGTAIMVLSMKGDAFDGFWYEKDRLQGEWLGKRGGKPPICMVIK